MNHHNQDKPFECPGACPSCPQAEQDKCQAGPEGWRLVVPVLGAFVLPLALALTGAALAGPDTTTQVVLSVAGLSLGVAGGVCVDRLILGRDGRRG